MKHRYPYSLLLSIFLLLLSGSTLFAQKSGNTYRFTENQGQWEEDIAYRLQHESGYLYLENNRVSWLQLDAGAIRQLHPQTAPLPDEPMRAHAWRVLFVGGSAKRPAAAMSVGTKDNYFLGNDPAHWASQVPSFQSVSYEDVWPGIGMRWLSQNGGIKYDLHIAPGSRTENIQLKYEGLERLYIKDGKLHLVTSLEEVIEAIPAAWQQIGNRKVPVNCEYRLVNDSTVTFAFPEGFDTRHRLVIDPVLIFSTYTGSFADNWGMTATYDATGNLYSGGIVNGVGYPTTTGALQINYAGGSAIFGNNSLFYNADMGIIKYDATGTTALYSTYIGGRNNDQPISLIVSDQNELYIMGITRSDNFPTTAGAFDRTLNGPFSFGPAGDVDMVILRLNAAGQALIGSTYIGGSGQDGINRVGNPLYHFYADDSRGEIVLDAAGNVLITGAVQSGNFPTTAGAFDRTLGGAQDAILFQMNSTLTTLNWSTYFGGSGFETGYSIALANNGNIYFVGGTTSPDVPATPGSWMPTFQSAVAGIPDGYVACINSNGSAILNCTYAGTAGYDQTYFLDLDQAGDVYIVGQTEGIYPTFGTKYNVPNGKQFITKLSPDLSRPRYSMRFGTGFAFRPKSDITMTAFLVDKCDNIYVSGWGSPSLDPLGTPSGTGSGSTQGLPVTPDAFNPVTDGSDFYLMVLYPDAADLNYATFFGGNQSHDHVDGGTSRFDKNGIVYHSSCASCFNPDLGIDPKNDFPSTPGAFSPTDNSNNCNNGSFKFDFELLNTTQASYDFDTLTTEGCAPYRVQFSNRSSGAIGYLWDFGDGSPISTDENPEHIYPNPGRFRVRLIAVNSGKCNRNDTLFQVVDVFQKTRVDFDVMLQVCTRTIDLSNSTPDGTTWKWNFGDGIESEDEQPATHSYLVSGDYDVELIVNPGTLCSDTLLQNITIPRLPEADFSIDVDPCNGTAAAAANSSVESLYEWLVDGVKSTEGQSVTLSFPGPGRYEVRLRTTSSEGCTESESQFVDVVINPSIGGKVESDHTVCRGQPSRLMNLTGNDGTVLGWEMSKDNGQSWIPLGKAGSPQLISGRLTVTSWFRAHVQRDACPEAFSDPAVVSIEPLKLRGQLLGSQSACLDSIEPQLELVNFNGQILQWEQSSDGGTSWQALPHTESRFSPGIIRQSTLFRVLLDFQSCGIGFSTEAEIGVLGEIQGGFTTGTDTICRGSASGFMQVQANKGGILRWEASKDDQQSWISIGKAGTDIIRSGRMTVSMWYRAISGRPGCPEKPSEPVLISVADQTLGGALAGGGSYCDAAGPVSLLLVGFKGSVLFWEQSTDNGVNWTAIPHIGVVYKTDSIFRSTRFRVVLGNPTCGNLRSQETEIKVIAKPIGGRAWPDHTVCRGQPSQPFMVTGYKGTISGWELSKDEGVSWIPLGKAGLASIRSGRLTVTTQFRAQVSSDGCGTASSIPITVVVEPQASNGEISGGGKYCQGDAFPLLKWSMPQSPVLRWERSTDKGNSWQPIAHTLPDYQPPGTLQQNIDFRVIRADGNCNGGASARASLNALGAASAGTLSAVGGNSTVCAGSDAPTIELSGAAGQVLYWEKRRVGDLFWEKLTETSRLLTNGPLSFPIDFRVRTEAKPCSPVVSAAFRINVQQTPFPGILSTTQKRVCFKTPVVSVNLQGLSVPVQAWEVKDVNSGNTALFPTAATSWDVLEPTGSFQIRARLDGGLCGNVFSDWLGIEVLDSLRLQVQSQAPCGGTAGLQAQASGSMGGPYLYRIEPPIVPANLNGSFIPLTLGTYQVFVLDGNGCRSSQTITVTSTVVPPSILRFDFVSTNSALVMWTSVPGTGVRYELRYRIKGEQKWTVRAPLTQTAIFLNGLQHSAQYEVQIVVLCPDGKGGFDPTPSPDIKTFVTKSSGACLDTPPAVPGGVYLNPIEAHAVTVHWSPITDLRSFQGYIISFGLSDIHPNNWPQLVVCHPDTFIRIQGFIPRRNYGVRIRTNCSNCTTALQSADKRSAWSHTLDFSTPDFRESARSSVSTVEELKLYPNPTRGGFYVEVPCSSGTPIELQVYDLLGRLIKTDERDTNGGIMEYDFDLAAGVYRLQFRYCGSEAEQALIVY